MTGSLPDSARRVQAALQARGLDCEVVQMPQTTRTAQEAAAAIGCTVAQIAKSLVFRAKDSDAPVLVIASGVNRVDETRVAGLCGETIVRADADFVRARTGFAIGGVPPLGHAAPIATYIDEDLLQFDAIWAAAGTPFAVFRLTPDDLVRATGGTVAPVKKA
jgi:prolyl-tRNA editing enzyme YbaK/EbsC (Cys-tRNA(Pro) deacylase)